MCFLCTYLFYFHINHPVGTVLSAFCEGEGSIHKFNVILYHRANLCLIQVVNNALTESWHSAPCHVLISHGTQKSPAYKSTGDGSQMAVFLICGIGKRVRFK